MHPEWLLVLLCFDASVQIVFGLVQAGASCLPGRVDPSVILLRYDLITNGTSSRIIFHARLPKGHGHFK
jgi:hypothetical protein